MSLGNVFVNRPIMATALNLVLLIVGLVAFDRLELRHTPTEAKNEFEVTTHYPGANAKTIELRITKPLEDALSGLEGIRKISSDSMDSMSQINVKFRADVNRDKAQSTLRDRVYATMTELPESVKKPEIQEKIEGIKPILYLGFEDPTRSVAELSDYIRRFVEDRLKLIEGVATVDRWGDRLYQISLLLDPARLNENQVSVSEVVNVLQKTKGFAPGGELERHAGLQTVFVNSNFVEPKELENTTVKVTPQGRVKVADLGEVKVTEKPTFLRIRVDGQYKVGLSVTVKPQANPITVAKKVKAFLKDLEKNLPPNMKTTVNYDATQSFDASIVSLQHTMWEAIILVAIIVILSLGSVRAAIIPLLTVPLCLIGAFALMWFFGFSVNPITLLALVLAVGLVVDDAIVVVENIHRHMEEGMTALQAARKGMKEITFAVVVMTFTLAAVYMPVAFQADDSAVMFKEFAWTLAGSVIISGVVALTLTPALCGRFLKKGSELTFWEKINQSYFGLLQKAFNNRKKILFLSLVVAFLAVWGFKSLQTELMPVEDEDYLMGFIFAENMVPDVVRETWLDDVEKILKDVDGRVKYATGEWQRRWLWWNIVLKPRKERKKGTKEITAELQEKFKTIVGPLVGVNTTAGGMGEDDNLKINFQHAGNYERLLTAIKAIQIEALKHPEFQQLESDQTKNVTRAQILVDKDLANELGVNLGSIEDTLFTFLSGKKTGTFEFNGLEYDVLVRGKLELRTELESMNQFFVPGGEGQWIPLGSLVKLQEVNEASQIKHIDRMRGASVNVNLKPAVSMEKAIEVLDPIIKKHLPPDAQYKFAGRVEKLQESQQAMWLTYGLALAFIYLVLTALFESFVHPLVVLVTVPLSIAGAVWLVKINGGTNNLYTSIGLVTLVGLITKHGILIVDFANKLKHTGMETVEAVSKAAMMRLRPVLMTTFAMVFGAVPLIFSLGGGAEARHHIGWVIIGGMICGTFFSLFVVPVVYSYLENRLLGSLSSPQKEASRL